MPVGLPRGVGAQQAAGSVLGATAASAGTQQAAVVDAEGADSLKTGILSSVWKCSQAMPCGSVTQCFSLRA